jgi:NAD(P)-dependent dehydrogenase (short-subunit alcohol dehydrogenase family)
MSSRNERVESEEGVVEVMSGSPEKKVALVTGAGGGMGKADVLALLETGWNIAAFDRDESRLDAFREANEKWASRIATYRVDVTSLKDVREAVSDASRLGPVLGVVNNAGIGSAKRLFRDIPVDDWREMLEVHLIGAVHCVLATLDGMEKAGFGRIVNISSYCAEVGSVGFSHYCAAKAALIGYTMSLALEEAEAGITVNAIAPGLVDTPMTAGDNDEVRALELTKIPLRRYGHPEEIGATVSFLFSDGAGYITGRVLGVNGGMVCR